QDCSALSQTMFFEVGFKFRNLVPEWFRMSAPKAEVDVMRRVAEELQQLLTLELLEWQQVTSGRVVSPLDARNLKDHSEEMKPEDAEGDSLMSSCEAELLGTECVTRWRSAVLRVYHLDAFETVIQTVTKSVDQVRNDKPLRKDMLARMESELDTTQAQLNQRVDQAFQAIQILAARPGVVKSTTIPNVEMPTIPVHVSTGVAEAAPSEATSHEVDRALKAAETQFEERWQRREAEAGKAKESWATNLQKSLNDQWESVMSTQMQRLQEEIASLKEARNQGQKANRRSKNLRGTSSSNTRATSTEIQGSRIAKTSGSRVQSRQTEAKSTGAARSEDKEPPKKELRAKPSRQDEDPSGPSSSGESSEEDDSSSDSDSSSDGMPPYTTMVTNAKGENMLTLRTFTNALDDFNEKQSLTARRRWWEKFLNMTIQTGWTEQMNIYEFKTKMSPAARNWMGQLGKRVRTNWGRLAREFKREYCKSRVSDSEKYYTMKQYKDETALAFLYRLNLAAERADVKFRKSERRREQHIKRFIKNLTDMSLRSTLQSQRFHMVSDLEYVLK
ncbi:putative mitochondrial protein, partial [Phytophthora megakarya]